MPQPWDTLLLAWLHDPVDKAADIKTHESRAARYASIILGLEVDKEELRIGHADQLASGYERLPMPNAKGRYEELGVSPENGKLTVIHPLSGRKRSISVAIPPERVEEVLRDLFGKEMDARRRFLTLWRLVPERLAQLQAGLAVQPADTRNPDHTLWNHLDTTAAIAWASRGGSPAFLSFKLGPVQNFIEASRSLRDLYTSSWILSHLAFAAMKPVLESCGPTAFIYPALRGLPVMDAWLCEKGVDVRMPEEQELIRPSIPHRFLAVVPSWALESLKKGVVESAQAAWLELTEQIRHSLKKKWDGEFPGWDRLWDAQIRCFWDFRTAGFVHAEARGQIEALLGKDAAGRFDAIAKMRGAAAAGDSAEPGHWQKLVELSAMLMDAITTIRHIPDYRADGDVPPKCTLFGTFEQMGPSRLSESDRFWKHVKENEGKDRLSAIGLVKRYALKEDIRFPDTGTVAGRYRSEKEPSRRSRYYAVLMMDGDRMGEWLSGGLSPKVGEVIHEKLAVWLAAHGAGEALELKRPVSPALHMAISSALNEFAVKRVPEIVGRHQGEVVYSGGDDVLAVLPVHTCLQCARDLREAFSSDEVLGERATASAGLVIAHYKEDLRLVLHEAREAEKAAKRGGRDRIHVVAMKRSGGLGRATCRWDFIEHFVRLFGLFGQGLTDRWTYQMQRQMDVLEGLPVEAFVLELERQLARGEARAVQASTVSSAFEAFTRRREANGASGAEAQLVGERLREFITVCQIASFMTRFGDEA